MEGATANHAFVNSSLGEIDILCLQEHWLHSFEKQKLAELFPQWNGHSVAYDENNQESHSRFSIGRGGVATVWQSWMDPYMKSAPTEGNERILVTLCNLPTRPMCFINCYLSSGTSSMAVEYFLEDMDCLSEIIIKYRTEYEIVLAGDINADHHHRNGTKEKRFRDLLQEFRLQDTGLSAKFSSYINPHLGHSSRIDHICIGRLKDTTPEWSVPEAIEEVTVANSSKHLPLATFTYIPPMRKSPKKEQTVGTSKERIIFEFNQADLGKFDDALQQGLNSHSLAPDTPVYSVATLQDALSIATKAAVPHRILQPRRSKNKGPLWTPQLKEAVKLSKNCLHAWKKAGKPQGAHPAWINKKKASREVRRVQRQENAHSRQALLQEISTSSANNDALFHKVIASQRQGKTTAKAILVKGNLTTDENVIREEWANYYETLATPQKDEPQLAELLSHMRTLASVEKDDIVLTTETIKKAIDGLSSRKAADREGFTAEHLKLLSTSTLGLRYLTNTLQTILRKRTVPDALRSAYKIPIAKKDKDPLIMDNYRGITITSIFSKLLEHICLTYCKEDINQQLSGLQFGFTEGRSPAMASLLVTEAIAETRETKEQLYICSLDARKAFDVVSHQRLKLKMFHTPMRRSLWCIIDDLYSSSPEAVRWLGQDSRDYNVRQGVKQGAVMSPTLYKLYANDLAASLTEARVGLHIGATYVGTPSCADDLLLLTTRAKELQSMMTVSFQHSETNLYQLHPVKSVVCPHKPLPGFPEEEQEWFLGDDPVSVTNKFTHLGLEWNAGKPTPDISPKITLARRTAYALMGVGMHGHNGLDPSASGKIYLTYVVPRLVYGIEAAKLSAAQVNQLELFHRKMLRQIQGLPENTAISAVYLLIGILPIEATIHIKLLSLFGAITRLERENPLWQVALRQLAIKPSTSKSWFAQIGNLGQLYDVDIHQALLHPWPKKSWKEHISTTVKDHWFTKLGEEAVSKSTLQWLLQEPYWIGKAHPLWDACCGKQHLVEAATTRARLLTGRSQLLADKSRYDASKDSSCPLCYQEKEDAAHFLVSCPALDNTRGQLIQSLCQIYIEDKQPPPESKAEICSAILNGWGYKRDPGKRNPETDKHTYTNTLFGSPIHPNSNISLKSNILKSNMLCSTICQKLKTVRDFQINYLLS